MFSEDYLWGEKKKRKKSHPSKHNKTTGGEKKEIALVNETQIGRK